MLGELVLTELFELNTNFYRDHALRGSILDTRDATPPASPNWTQLNNKFRLLFVDFARGSEPIMT